MDQAISPQSELLHSRLRDHKAETARSQKQSPYTGGSDYQPQPGRDDDIFLDDDPTINARRALSKRNSPAAPAPSAWRYDRDSSRNRPSNNLSSSTSTTPRAMGAREMEEHIDKLNKQNFNLKMEVFHRREKIEQLEKKLADHAQLEEDLTGALDANEELVAALESRDRAIDEAVVIISDLEQKNRDLEAQLAEAKIAAATRTDSLADESTVPPISGRKSQKTPRKSKDRKSLANSVSPDVSARMMELSLSPNKDDDEPGIIPSFLKSNEPATAALRSMYVEGDQFVRPLPSYATLTTNGNIEANEDYLSGLRSPRLSELSESDLKSIYNREGQTTNQLEENNILSTQEDITQQTNARVSKWLAERAVSPVSSHDKPQGPHNGDFQSLDHVIKRQPDMALLDLDIKPRGRQLALHKPEKSGNTPPMSLNPTFGQNMFPPTPDTMLTRASNTSSNSFAPDKPQPESFTTTQNNSFASSHQDQPTTLHSPNPIKYAAPNSLLPHEFDAYGSPPQERKSRPAERRTEYGDDAMYRGYSSDGSFTQRNNPRYTHQNQNSLTGTTVIDVESSRGTLTTRHSPSPPEDPSFEGGWRAGYSDYPTLPYRSFASAPRDRYQQTSSVGQITPTNPSFSQFSHGRQESATSNLRTPTQAQPLPLSLASGLPMSSQSNAVPPPAAPVASPIAVRSTKSLAARTASIRDRFLRRKTVVEPTVEAPKIETESPQGRRSSSITRRFRLRRSSSEQAPVPSLPQTAAMHYPYSATGTSTVTSTVNNSFVSSTDNGYVANDQSSTTLPSLLQRAKSERHRAPKSVTGQSERSVFSTSSYRANAPATPDSYGASGGTSSNNLSPGSINYGSRPRRPSLSGRLSSEHRKAYSSNTDIPPVPATPPEILKWEAEPDSANRVSKWHLSGRSRSNSRSRKEPTWPTLTAHDGTLAGRRM